MKRIQIALLLAAMALAAPTLGQMQGHDMKGHDMKSSAQPGAMGDGEVRKVDKDAQKVTVRHGPLPQLDMPMAMTMVYRVKDPAMLDQVKPGDKIRFSAEKIGGQFILTRIEKSN